MIAPHIRSARGGARGRRRGEISASGRALRGRRAAAPALPLVSRRRGERRDERGDHGRGAVRDRRRDRAGRRDRRGRGRRPGADRHERPPRRHGPGRASTSTSACATPMRAPSPPAGSTASTSAWADSSTRPKLVAEFVKMGARYVSTGTDLAFLLAESTARAKQVHEMRARNEKARCSDWLRCSPRRARSRKLFPSKPVRVVVAFPAGGGTDIVARLLAPRLERSLGPAGDRRQPRRRERRDRHRVRRALGPGRPHALPRNPRQSRGEPAPLSRRWRSTPARFRAGDAGRRGALRDGGEPVAAGAQRRAS